MYRLDFYILEMGVCLCVQPGSDQEITRSTVRLSSLVPTGIVYGTYPYTVEGRGYNYNTAVVGPNENQ